MKWLSRRKRTGESSATQPGAAGPQTAGETGAAQPGAAGPQTTGETGSPPTEATGKQATGRAGEAIAARLLHRKGFRLLERNYLCEVGEIDLIAEDRGTVVFVEVKTRRSIDHGLPEEAVDREKRRRLRRAARWYMQPWSRWPQRIRFDVVGIELGEDDQILDVRHTPNAFGDEES